MRPLALVPMHKLALVPLQKLALVRVLAVPVLPMPGMKTPTALLLRLLHSTTPSPPRPRLGVEVGVEVRVGVEVGVVPPWPWQRLTPWPRPRRPPRVQVSLRIIHPHFYSSLLFLHPLFTLPSPSLHPPFTLPSPSLHSLSLDSPCPLPAALSPDSFTEFTCGDPQAAVRICTAPYQHILSTHPINTSYQYTILIHPIDTPKPRYVLHPINTPCQHTLSTPLDNTLY